MGLRWRHALLLSGVLGPMAASHAAEPPAQGAQARLEQAREQLLQQALQSSTRVDAWSWIDAQGRLQEHQSMRQWVELPALQGGAPGGGAKDLLRSAATTDKACPHPAEKPLRAALALRTSWSAQWPSAVRERLQESVQSRWLSDDSVRPWRVFPAHEERAGMSAYDRYLVLPPVVQSPWRLDLQLEPLPSERPELVRMAWRMTVTQRETLLLERRADLALPQQHRAWGAPEWTPQAWEQVHLLLQQWAQLLDQHFACASVQPQVVAQEGPRWVLDMGALAGIRVGDEWALIDPAWLPERTLEPGAIAQMVVARVVRAEPMRAELVLVAGEPSQPRTGWVAQALHAKTTDLNARWTPASARR
jgi:hypothetical protein